MSSDVKVDYIVTMTVTFTLEIVVLDFASVSDTSVSQTHLVVRVLAFFWSDCKAKRSLWNGDVGPPLYPSSCQFICVLLREVLFLDQFTKTIHSNSFKLPWLELRTAFVCDLDFDLIFPDAMSNVFEVNSHKGKTVSVQTFKLRLWTLENTLTLMTMWHWLRSLC